MEDDGHGGGSDHAEVAGFLRGGQPVAKLVPYRVPARRELGFDAGVVTVTDDFDAPLPTDLENSFYG